MAFNTIIGPRLAHTDLKLVLLSHLYGGNAEATVCTLAGFNTPIISQNIELLMFAYQLKNK